MVLIHEWRILHPYTVEEYERGNTYGNYKTVEQMQSGGQGSELLSSTPYYDEVYGEGIFNVSQTRPGNKLPAWTSKLISPEQVVLDDKTWFLFPFVRTVITTPALAKLKIETLTLSLNDRGTTENALGLTKDQLAIRTVEFIDIGAEKMDPADYREDRDPSLVQSKVAEKGPLTPGWQDREKRVMCAYKVIIAECSYFGVQGRAEQLLVSSVRKVTVMAHKTAYCTIDEWYPMTLEQVMDLRDSSRKASGAKVLEHRSASKRRLSESGSESDPVPMLEDSDDDESGDGDDLFLDAEMELILEQQDIGADHFAGMANQPPPGCPFCAAQNKTLPSAPSLYCSTCTEFFCSVCFTQVHITQRMKQHSTKPVTAPRAGVSMFQSLSMAGPIAVQLPQEAVMRRNASRAGKHKETLTAGAEATPAKDSSFAEMLNLSGVLTWDKVKDPPLNIFSVERNHPTGLTGDRPAWWGLLCGSADDLFIEIPAELPRTEVPAAMVTILSALYRSGNSSDLAASSLSSTFPLGTFMPEPEAESMAKWFPDLATPDAAPSRPLSQEQLARGVLTKSPYGTGTVLQGEYRYATEVSSLPVASPSPSLGEQQVQAARLVRCLAEELLALDPLEIRRTGGPAVAFWVNLHNALLLHAYVVFGVPKVPKDLSVLLQKAAYLVGETRFSAASIVQTVLRPGDTATQMGLASGLPLVGRLMASNIQVSGAAVESLEPYAIFALSLGIFSSPLVRPIHAAGLKEQLEGAARAFLEATVRVGKAKIHLPMLFYSHRYDFGKTRDEQLVTLLRLLPPSLAKDASDRANALTTGVTDMLSGVSAVSLDAFKGKLPTSMLMKVKLFEVEPDDNRFRYLFPLK